MAHLYIFLLPLTEIKFTIIHILIRQLQPKCMALVTRYESPTFVTGIKENSLVLLRGEHAKYNWPWKKTQILQIESTYESLQRLTLWFFIVIAKASLIGNCNRLSWEAISIGIIGVRGSSISSPLKLPLKIVASMTLFKHFLTANLVPL